MKSESGKLIVMFCVIMAFVVSGFEHCVANMYYIPAGLLALEVPHYAELAREAGVAVESLTWSRFFLQNLLPVTVGNLMGGCGFAALIWSVYHRAGRWSGVPLPGTEKPQICPFNRIRIPGIQNRGEWMRHGRRGGERTAFWLQTGSGPGREREPLSPARFIRRI